MPPASASDDLDDDAPWRLHALVWQQQPTKTVVQRCSADRPLCPAAQEAVLQILASPVCQAASPSRCYVARLVKQLIAAVEDHHQQQQQQQQEFSDGLLELNTALLLQAGGAPSDEPNWRYKTFYYSSSPSWPQLQQLQRQHCQHIQLAATCRDSGGAAAPQSPQQQEQHGWSLPAHLQQRLCQRQQSMQQLLAAVHWQDQQQQLAGVASPAADTDLTSCSSSSSSSSAGLMTIHSSDNLFEGGTGCHMWDAGFLLAEFVLNRPDLFAGKHVLEVGCGPGLVALALCRSGAGRVLLTDGDPQTLVNCLSNLAINGHRDSALLGSWREACGFAVQHDSACASSSVQDHSPQVLACPLDWHDDVPGLCADVILGSDVCYDPEAVPSLVKLLGQLLTPQQPQPQAYISTTKRQDSTLQLFLDLCKQTGLLVEDVARDPAAWVAAANSSSSQQSCARRPVVFRELPALQGPEGREQYVLHRVTRRPQ